MLNCFSDCFSFWTKHLSDWIGLQISGLAAELAEQSSSWERCSDLSHLVTISKVVPLNYLDDESVLLLSMNLPLLPVLRQEDFYLLQHCCISVMISKPSFVTSMVKFLADLPSYLLTQC
jgi:hypothetical protein